ncbi:hypothetical protein ACHAXH_002442 [Discostella pseudostelligera]
MGNLLNAPILEKDTHVGRTVDQYFHIQHSREDDEGDAAVSSGSGDRNDKTSTGKTNSKKVLQSPDGGGLHYGISSMQGWRVHMEDAHIAQPYLFAEEECSSSSKSSSQLIKDTNADNESIDEARKNTSDRSNSSNDNTKSKNNYIIHPLHNHSLFAIFDGHGGKYAANFSSHNLLRILSRNSNFVQYARGWNGRMDYLEKLKRECGCTSSSGGGGGGGGGGDSRSDLNVGKKTNDVGETSGKIYAESSTSTIDKSTSGSSVSGDNGGGSGDVTENASTNHPPPTAAAADAETGSSNSKPSLSSTSSSTPSNETTTNTIENNDNDNPVVDDIDERHRRLRQLKKRGHECDERVRAIKDQVRRCFKEDAEDSNEEDDEDDDDVSDENVGDNHTLNDDSAPDNENDDDDSGEEEFTDAYYRAEAAHDRHLMTLLESSLRDAFLDLDAEMLAEMRGDDSPGRAPYGAGYELDKLLGYAGTALGGGEGRGECSGVGHLPAEYRSDGAAAMEDDDHDIDDNNNKPDIEVDAGTTAVVVLLTPKWIVCANAGDSRAVYSRSSHRSVPLSYDHKPSDEAEERRIRNAGGYVAGGRVEADLAVSRGLGDYRFKELDVVASGSMGENRHGKKECAARGGSRTMTITVGGDDDDDDDATMMRPSEQKVSPVPDIIVQNRDPKEDEFIVLACDGIWDVQTNQECVRMVADIFAGGESDMGLVCEEILDQCLLKGSKDNMTAAVITFPKQAIGEGGGVLARRERRRKTQSSNI